MRIALVNVPHPSIGSRVPDDHLPPLGLLAIGGPLIDAGHTVSLVDGELKNLSLKQLSDEIVNLNPEIVMFGHSGSTSAHPIIREAAAAIKEMLPATVIVYGGVFPTYHWQEILDDDPFVDAIVRGEGENTTVQLAEAIEKKTPLHNVRGISYRQDGCTKSTPPADLIKNLDSYRIGWELIDHKRYSYWGKKRAVVVQFSRGCPHPCTYCGQRGFWTRWRHRDPVLFAKEIAWLHREHGVEVFNFADENPTSSKKAWKEFLNALIAENINVLLVGSTRADDIVRDADILHLYKKAGVIRWLLGMETTDEDTMTLIKKGSTTTKDREAIQLLRQHDIVSMATWVVGFQEERVPDLWRVFRQMLVYDPDQIQAVFVTPHRWTPFFSASANRTVIQLDKTRWDYKHQVLATKYMSPWLLFLGVKLIEALVQSRPRALHRIFFHRDRDVRHAMRWYTRIGRRVWFFEWKQFLFKDQRTIAGPSAAEFWGQPSSGGEEAMSVPARHNRAGLVRESITS